MDAPDALSTARTEFRSRLADVTADDWARQTPCPDWDVRALVNHVIGGNRRYVMLLHGASADEVNATRVLDHLGTDPVDAFEATADEVEAAFREPGALVAVVKHPAGDRTGEVLLEMRIVDFAVHAWDLACAIGARGDLDADLVRFLSDRAELADQGRRDGFYGAAASGPPGEPLQNRVLRLFGRSPDWRSDVVGGSR